MCKICKNKTIDKAIKNINYHFCPFCGFLAKDDSVILDSDKEFERYQKHDNNDNMGYVKYQEDFYQMIKDYLGKNVLDYGCGNGHILANIINKNEHVCSYYDLYFYPKENIEKSLYNAIILEEVVEHLKDPVLVLSNVIKFLDSNGNLIIRTRFIPSNVFDSDWWYLRDTTHISFFDIKTFEYLSKVFGLEIIYCNDKDLIILKKV